jgi:hypothetical protein
MIGAGAGVLVGAAVLKIAPSIVPTDLLSAAVRLSFDGRVFAFWAVAALTAWTLRPWHPGTLAPWHPGTLAPWHP